MKQKVLLALLLTAALATTALIAVNVLAHRQDQHPFSSSQADALPPLGNVPAFALIDQDGNPIDRDRLLGKIWIADFVFTRCSGPCLRMTRRMRRLQQEFAGLSADIRFLSVSVDPEYDTPQVLRQYATRHDADTETWRFATTQRTDLHRLVIEGFKLPLEDAGNSEHRILHSDRFVLVDQQGRIRGYYHGMTQRAPDGTVLPAEMDQLVSDVRKLLSAEPASQEGSS